MREVSSDYDVGGRGGGEGIRIRHLNKNAGFKEKNKLPNTLFPQMPGYRTLSSPNGPSASSLEDDCSDVWFHSFLTTLSLNKMSAPGLGSVHVHAAQITT